MNYKLIKIDDETLKLESHERSGYDVLHDYMANYVSFFEYFEKKICEEESLVDFILEKNVLSIITMHFEKPIFYKRTFKIFIDDKLLKESSFREKLNFLLKLFRDKKYQIREKIKLKQQEYYSDSNMQDIVRILLDSFNNTRTIGEIDDELVIALYHYIRIHERELLKLERKDIKGLKTKKYIVNMGLIFIAGSACLGNFLYSLGSFSSFIFGTVLSSYIAFGGLVYKNYKYFKSITVKEFMSYCRSKYFEVFRKKNFFYINGKRANDEIFDFIKLDYFHMRHRTDIDYRDLMEDLEILLEEIKGIVDDEKTDRLYLMQCLLDIEILIFSRKNRGLPKNKKDIVINKIILDRRLEYLGIDLDNYDSFILDAIHKLVERIETFPYEGCELEVIKLLKIVLEELLGENRKVDRQKVFLKLDKIEKEIVKNINENYSEKEVIDFKKSFLDEKKFIL